MTSLVYVDDSSPGISRKPARTGFTYHAPDGKRLRDAAQLARIKALVIPPAYTDVWICPLAQGHLQATGRDARGRKQYRYHAAWRSEREADKFARVAEFGKALPSIRRRVARDLAAAPGTPTREAVLAAVVRLLDTTLVRVGNEEYARSNGSYGLTTLRTRHAKVKGSRISLRFRGKSGVLHALDLADPQVARIVRRCQSLPGQELFRYEAEDGSSHSIGSAEVNDYLRDIAAADITAKDFRTWHGSVLALTLLRQAPPPTTVDMLKEVAGRLRNTVAVCRKSYVHPRVLRASIDQIVVEAPEAPRQRGLSPDESALLRFIRHRPPKAAAASRRPDSNAPAQEQRPIRRRAAESSGSAHARSPRST